MGKIALEGLEFYAHHGYYDHERDQGNNFLVDVEIKTNFAKAALEDNLSETVDYESIYALVEEEMERPSKLIEHVAERIAQNIIARFSVINKVKVSVSKLNPPIKGKCRLAKITVSKRR